MNIANNLLTFQINAQSFFQVNTLAAEKLYNIIYTWCHISTPLSINNPSIINTNLLSSNTRPKENVMILDICCGSGTIGIGLAKQVHSIIGLELIPEAIEDAKYNCQLNNINNCTYICGRAEETLKQALQIYYQQLKKNPQLQLIGIVDPPRSGLHPNVIKLLRNCIELNKLIYVSCNPNTLKNNLTKLISPASNKFKHNPFKPICAIPVDMFPYTDHCELVLYLQRN